MVLICCIIKLIYPLKLEREGITASSIFIKNNYYTLHWKVKTHDQVCELIKNLFIL